MKPERTSIILANLHKEPIIAARALRLGEWCVHMPLGDEPGLVLAHKSGISAIRRCSPNRAKRLLRTLQHAPACPLTDEELRELIPNAPQERSHPVFAWIADIRRLIAESDQADSR